MGARVEHDIDLLRRASRAAWSSIASQGNYTQLHRAIPPKLEHTEGNARASPYAEAPCVAPVEQNNHPSAVTWRGKANNPSAPSSAPPRKPHRNQVVGVHITFFTEKELYGFEHSRSVTIRPSAAAEVGDIRLAGRGPKRAFKALTETSLLVSRQIRDT